MEIDYKKYKWFFTSGGKLVVGGKSALQNDELLARLKRMGGDFFVMHTHEPGSPFCAIIAEDNKVTKKDLEECAVFTGCFSRAWRSGKKKTEVDIFKLGDVSKGGGMKVGTWGVKNKIERKEVELKLVLVKQDGVLRAVPEKSAEKKLAIVFPGKIDKNKIADDIRNKLKDKKIMNDEILSALPAGGVRIE